MLYSVTVLNLSIREHWLSDFFIFFMLCLVTKNKSGGLVSRQKWHQQIYDYLILLHLNYGAVRPLITGYQL